MTPPKIIYLQWYDEEGEELDLNGNDITWCQDEINETDVAYVLQGTKLIQCPFCQEDDFDLVGLKYHLQNYCEKYNIIQEVKRVK